MGLTINSNINALKAGRENDKSSRSLNSAFERLASGKRITSAAVDAAGLAIAVAQASEADQAAVAARNVSDFVSATRIAEGGLESAENISGRIGELATQAANGTNSASQLSAIQQEINSLTAELDRIAQTTSFNGQQLLSSDSTLTAQVGTDGSANSQLDVEFQSVSAASLGLGGIDVTTQDGAQAAIDAAKGATDSIASTRGGLGAAESRLQTAFTGLQVKRENLIASSSAITDADVATETANLTNSRIRQQASVAVLGQANQSASLALSLLGGGG